MYPPDSATQPTPHYCTLLPGTGRWTGCPSWPDCATTPSEPDDDPEPEDDDEVPELASSLAALAGFAAGCVLFLIAVALLLPALLS